jgi:hypothetical protein
MSIKRKKKKLSTKKMQQGTVGNFFVFGVLALLIVAGITAVGGLPSETQPTSGTEVNIVTPTENPTHSTLQLQTFGYVTIAPTPTLAPIAGSPLCQPGGANDEPGIISATSPASGQTVSATGQIKVWVDDEGAPIIAQGETTNSDGSIANKGNQTQLAPDNYLFEPAVYIDSATAESGGSPFFPDYIKGQYNNDPNDTSAGFARNSNNIVTGAAIDTPPAGASTAGCIFGSNFFPNCYKAEYIWNVSSLGLSAGTHRAEFVIHDGDFNRGVGCVNIQVQ